MYLSIDWNNVEIQMICGVKEPKTKKIYFNKSTKMKKSKRGNFIVLDLGFLPKRKLVYIFLYDDQKISQSRTISITFWFYVSIET